MSTTARFECFDCAANVRVVDGFDCTGCKRAQGPAATEFMFIRCSSCVQSCEACHKLFCANCMRTICVICGEDALCEWCGRGLAERAHPSPREWKARVEWERNYKCERHVDETVVACEIGPECGCNDKLWNVPVEPLDVLEMGASSAPPRKDGYVEPCDALELPTAADYSHVGSTVFQTKPR